MATDDPFILTAHQPVYLPWLGLFHKIAVADQFISFDQVQYLRKDWNNRNKIKTNQGDIWLTVPVLSKGSMEKPICDIEINNSLAWGKKHWKSIEMAYKKAPHFDRYGGFFQDVYSQHWETLETLNTHMLRWFLEVLGITVPVRSAGEYDFQGAKSDLVLDMCRTVGADIYVFGALGRDYADVEVFERGGVRPVFQNYLHPTYSQLHGDFISHLSILDLLFNHGPDSREILMSGNVDRQTLIEVCEI